MRDRLLNLRINDEEKERLQRVADHYGLNVASTVRFLVKREDDAIVVKKRPSKKAVERRRDEDD